MRDPSEVARNFCSLTQRIDELTKLTPLVSIAACVELQQELHLVVERRPRTGPSRTRSSRVVTAVDGRQRDALALEPRVGPRDVDGCRRRRGAPPRRSACGLAANPHVPLTSTRTPKPALWLRETFCTCCSRVEIASERRRLTRTSAYEAPRRRAAASAASARSLRMASTADACAASASRIQGANRVMPTTPKETVAALMKSRRLAIFFHLRRGPTPAAFLR